MEVKGADAEDIDRAFATVQRERPAGLVVHGDQMLIVNRRRIADHAVKLRIPAVYTNSIWTEAGGLVSYGAHFPDLYRRAATNVDKILKGAKPADLPVEQPSKFELIVNLKAAQAMELTNPAVAAGPRRSRDRVMGVSPRGVHAGPSRAPPSTSWRSR